MMMALDDLDHRILKDLQEDATVSMDALADRVGRSRNAVWTRVKRLEQAGVIRGRVALVDPVAVGCPLSVVVLIRTSAHDPKWMEDFQRTVQRLPEVIGAYRMTGDLDYMLRVRVADVAAYDVFYKRLITGVEVSDISASFVMEDIKDTTALPL